MTQPYMIKAAVALRPYGSLFVARFRVLLQYRAAALAGFGTQLFWGLIRIMIFDAFYRSSAGPQPMSQGQVISYVWLGQALLVMLPWNVDPDVKAMIRSGAVAYELIRPVDLYCFWYCRSLALRTAPAIMRAVPLFIVAGLFFGLKPPPTVAAGCGWVVATLASLLLGCAFSVLMNISMLWTVAGEGISRLAPAVVYALSGMLIPLPLYPAWFQPVLHALPFRDMVDVPFRVYVGSIPVSALAGTLAEQAAWIICLVLFGRWLLAREIRRLVVQGG